MSALAVDDIFCGAADFAVDAAFAADAAFFVDAALVIDADFVDAAFACWYPVNIICFSFSQAFYLIMSYFIFVFTWIICFKRFCGIKDVVV